MCREAVLEDEEIRTVCASIAAGQHQEIDQMNLILSRLR